MPPENLNFGEMTETVNVVGDDGKPLRINKSDFDPNKHSVVEDTPTGEEGSKEAESRSAGTSNNQTGNGSTLEPVAGTSATTTQPGDGGNGNAPVQQHPSSDPGGNGQAIGGQKWADPSAAKFVNQIDNAWYVVDANNLRFEKQKAAGYPTKEAAEAAAQKLDK